MNEQTTETPLPQSPDVAGFSSEKLEQLKKEVAAEQASLPGIPPPRKCIIEQVLPCNVINLLKAGPANETIRAMVLAAIKVPVPPEHITFESVKEWIETNITVPQSVKPKTSSVVVRIFASETESGDCHYSVHREGTGEYRLSPETIQSIAEDSDDWDDFVSRVTDEIRGNYGTDSINFEEGEYNYKDHETTDSESDDFYIRNNDALADSLRSVCPEEAARIFGED